MIVIQLVFKAYHQSNRQLPSLVLLCWHKFTLGLCWTFATVDFFPFPWSHLVRYLSELLHQWSSPSAPSSLQIRRALLQILFPDKPFRWVVHIGIAFCLIFLVNLLVIFVPSIRDIFGLIGRTPTVATAGVSYLSTVTSSVTVDSAPLCRPAQEPPRPPASSSSFLESSTCELFRRIRSLFCPDLRFRFCLSSFHRHGRNEVILVHLINVIVTFHVHRPPASLAWDSSSWSWVCRSSSLTGWPASPEVEVDISCRDWPKRATTECQLKCSLSLN